MARLVVFDWNGTLLADTGACLDADNHVLRHFGGKPVSLKEFRATFTIPAISFYAAHGCDRERLGRESKELGEVFHGFYERRATRVRSRRGAKHLLEWLRKNGAQSVILSNHTVNGIESQLRRLGLKELVGAVLANTELDTSMKARNKAERLEDYIRSGGFEKRDVMIVGDTTEEIELGRKIGIKTVAITGGYYSTARLRKAKPDYLINSLDELTKIVHKS